MCNHFRTENKLNRFHNLLTGNLQLGQQESMSDHFAKQPSAIQLCTCQQQAVVRTYQDSTPGFDKGSVLLQGIYDTLKECACISKSAGGIGLSMHNIRSTGSYIRGTNGNSNGIVPMLRVFNDTARYSICAPACAALGTHHILLNVAVF